MTFFNQQMSHTAAAEAGSISGGPHVQRRSVTASDDTWRM